MSDSNDQTLEVFVPVAVSYQVASDTELATAAARDAQLVAGDGDFEAAPWPAADQVANVWAPFEPLPEEDIDDSYRWQRHPGFTARALADVERAFVALTGLITLYQTHQLSEGPALSSAEDQCRDLHRLLARLDLTVPPHRHDVEEPY